MLFTLGGVFAGCRCLLTLYATRRRPYDGSGCSLWPSVSPSKVSPFLSFPSPRPTATARRLDIK